MKTNCHKCQFAEEIPGDCHLRCTAFNPLLTFSEHGIRNGWANYPMNFDPTWMNEECHQFRDRNANPVRGLIKGVGFADVKDFEIKGGSLSHPADLLASTHPTLAAIYGFNTAMVIVTDTMNNIKLGEKDEQN